MTVSMLRAKLRAPSDDKDPEHRLAELAQIREGFIRYARDRLLLDEDWHALSDVANDLRETDVEIRMLEAQRAADEPKEGKLLQFPLVVTFASGTIDDVLCQMRAFLNEKQK